MNNNPTVSFLLPAYKGIHLAESIESILAQTYKDFELIIINDSSPEDIEGILSKYKDSRIKYYKNDINIGQKNLITQWNKCLNLAIGEWTVMASDDDIYHPEYLQEMIRLSEKWPQNDVFHCNILTIDDNNNITNVSPSICEHETILQNIYYRLTYQRTEAFQDYFIRTKRIKDLGGYIFFPTATFSDVTSIVSVAGENGIICSNKYLFKWRCNNKNISSSTNTCKDRIEACEQLSSWIIDNYYMFNFLTDEVSLWIKKRFLQDIKYHITNSAKCLIQQMSWTDMQSIIKQKNWSYRLFDRKYVKRNRLIRIKNKIKMFIYKF